MIPCVITEEILVYRNGCICIRYLNQCDMIYHHVFWGNIQFTLEFFEWPDLRDQGVPDNLPGGCQLINFLTAATWSWSHRDHEISGLSLVLDLICLSAEGIAFLFRLSEHYIGPLICAWTYKDLFPFSNVTADGTNEYIELITNSWPCFCDILAFMFSKRELSKNAASCATLPLKLKRWPESAKSDCLRSVGWFAKSVRRTGS
jgi:hypothetical protein